MLLPLVYDYFPSLLVLWQLDDAVKGFFTGNIVEYDRLSGGEAIIGFDTAQDANSALDQNDAALDDSMFHLFLLQGSFIFLFYSLK